MSSLEGINTDLLMTTVKGLLNTINQSERLRILRSVPANILTALLDNKDLFSEAIQKTIERVHIEKSMPQGAPPTLEPSATLVAPVGGRRTGKRRSKVRSQKTRRNRRR